MDTEIDIYEEESVLLVNELKIKWYTLLSRVDASPTIDETVLTSLNSIGNLISSNHPTNVGYDFLFQSAIRLGVFESIFRWNFVFRGADLEAFKAKELQFYDSLITGDGKRFLRYPEFAVPLLATLHHCAIRSSLPVERVLIRTLNSVCAAICTQLNDSITSAETGHKGQENTTKESGIELNEDFSFFRRLSMGLVADCRHQMELKSHHSNINAAQYAPEFMGFNSEPGGSTIKMADAVDWPLSIDAKQSGATNSMSKSLERSMSVTSHDSTSNIDSIFDLLIPFVFREGDLGWQARDAFLLVATYSNKDEDFSYSLAQNSSVCPVLATGLATLYAELPRELITNNYPQSWPELVQTMEEQEQKCPQFVEFFEALEFCESVMEVAHPLIQSSLLQFIHSGFFVSVLGFSLTKPNVLEVITATVLLKEILLRTTNSAILPALLRFLLTTMPTEKRPKVSNGLSKSESDPEQNSNLSNLSVDPQAIDNQGPAKSTSEPNLTYMDLLISRLHYCNTLLGVATLSLFNTILNLNCEDVMFYLVLRYLVPFRDALLSLNWSWPEPNTFVRASDDFLDLITSYSHGSSSKHRRWTASEASGASSLTGSVAELNLDEDTDTNTVSVPVVGIVTSEWSEPSSSADLVRGKAHINQRLSNHSGFAVPSDNSQKGDSLGAAPMEALMPVHSESLNSPMMNGVDQVTELNGTKLNQFKHLFRRRKPRWEGAQSLTAITPDDWLKYTNWARESIQQRVQACTRWRLTFDATYPSAAQMAQFELCWNQIRAKNQKKDTIDNNLSAKQDPSSRKTRPDVSESHERFKCLVNHNPTTMDTRQKEGERTAQALRSKVTKLDIGVELDLDEGDELDNEIQDWYKSPYSPMRLTKQNSGYLTTGDSVLSSESTHQTNSKQYITNGNGPGLSGAMLQNNRPNSSYSEDDDSSDSGCPVTEARSVLDRKNELPTVPISMSERNLSSVKVVSPGLSNSSAVKSWYCLNYLESDSSEQMPDGEFFDRPPSQPPVEQDELHKVDLSQQQCNTSTPKMKNGQPNASDDLTRPEVRAVLDASKKDDFEHFVQSLDNVHWDVLDSAQSNQKAYATDLQNYALYFDQVLTDETCHTDSHNDSVHQRSSRQTDLRSSYRAVSRNAPYEHTFSADALVAEHGSEQTRKEVSCAETSLCVYTPPLTPQNAINVTENVSSPSLLRRSVSQQPSSLEPTKSTTTDFLGSLTRRHSIQGTESNRYMDSTNGVESVSKAGSEYLNPTNIPNLGPFLTTIIARLESLPHNCFYANLYLTSILSSLASYSQPLLRAVMLLVPPTASSDKPNPHRNSMNSDTSDELSTGRALHEAYSQLPYAVLCSVRKQLDLFSIQYTMCPPDGMSMSFMGLVMDAKQYFRHANESPCPFTLNTPIPNGTDDTDVAPKESWRHRISFLRRLFNRSRKNTSSAVSNQPRPGPMCMEEVTPNRVSVKLSPHGYPQPGRAKVNARQVSHYAWLPEVGLPSHSSLIEDDLDRSAKNLSKKVKKRPQQKQTNRSQVVRRSSLMRSNSDAKDAIDWPAVQRMVLCAVIFEEFCKEMAALCIEHSVRG